MVGHLLGDHAPGWRNPFAAFQSVHHLLLSHGLAVEALRDTASRPTKIGIALNLSPVHPATTKEPDLLAAERYDGVGNRLLLDPLLKGYYPEDVVRRFGLFFTSVIRTHDLARISTPLDFVGINYYTRAVIRHDWRIPFLQAYPVSPLGNDYSPMWEIYPNGIYELLNRIWRDYQPKTLFVTENGVPVHDRLTPDGQVLDQPRIDYLHSHLVQVHRAIEEGIPILGYLVWSLLDNFEWNLGYQMRFGLIHIDYANLTRTIKQSGYWFSDVIRNNGLVINSA
jgi:beta-glucosidase